LQYLTSQGRLIAGLELRVVQAGAESTVMPHDGSTVGEIQIRGPWVTAAYLNYEDNSDFDEGWLRTGDLGSVDSDGYLRLSDRLKDAIKSGGEWISSLELEKAI